MYTMLTGKAPFQGRRVGDTLANARSGRYAVPEGLSDTARDFLASMLSLVSTSPVEGGGGGRGKGGEEGVRRMTTHNAEEKQGEGGCG